VQATTGVLRRCLVNLLVAGVRRSSVSVCLNVRTITQKRMTPKAQSVQIRYRRMILGYTTISDVIFGLKGQMSRSQGGSQSVSLHSIKCSATSCHHFHRPSITACLLFIPRSKFTFCYFYPMLVVDLSPRLGDRAGGLGDGSPPARSRGGSTVS